MKLYYLLYLNIISNYYIIIDDINSLKMSSFIILALMLIVFLIMAMVGLSIKCCIVVVPERRTVILERLGKFKS